ncbi:MAG: DivIVA domain-containing protein [Bacillota bacterium]|nr:MAG: DivIVA domain-containing protein [Bacillota bacterium]
MPHCEVNPLTLTPLDIHNKEFGRAWRGYSEAEVDDFLDLVVKEFEALIRENGELKDRLDELERVLERYKTIEDSLNKTLLLAQQAAEDVRQVGEKEARLIKERAMVEAQQVIDEARARAKQAVEDYSEMRREVELFRLRMKTLLEAQLEIFEEAALKDEGEPASPFFTGRRAREITSRYGRQNRDAGDEGDAETESHIEAAALDFRGQTRNRAARVPGTGRPQLFETEPVPEGPARPNLWGEPAGAVDTVPARSRPGLEPAEALEEDRDDGDEETW